MIELDGSSLTIEDLVRIADQFEPVTLASGVAGRVHASRAVVEQRAEGTEAVYGVNTGFGLFADVKIPRDELERLQLNLVRSHAAGVGDPLPVRAVRATLTLRANVLAKGFSGIRMETLEALIALINERVHPLVPSRGSVGASGDLAPLAHVAHVLIGEGQTWDGTRARPAAEALAAAGLRAVSLQAKEGLALINGTQPSTAVAALALAGAERLARAADITAALSIDALLGSAHPFEPRIHRERPFEGQQESAANLAALLALSPLNRSHEGCGRVQDAYSLRCVPQVHGAARDALRFVRKTLSTELNAATDNPMVFGDTGEIVSGGNFHGAPVAIAADLLAIALCPIATISERRSERLVNPNLSGLPAFLTRHGGVQSGFMIAQIAAAALTSELKGLAHPASVDTIPTSANKEDHVSMSMGAALKAERALDLARHVLAVEVMCACQALDLLAPLVTSPPLVRTHAAVRRHVPTLVDDRPLTADIEQIVKMIANGTLEDACQMDVK